MTSKKEKDAVRKKTLHTVRLRHYAKSSILRKTTNFVPQTDGNKCKSQWRERKLNSTLQ